MMTRFALHLTAFALALGLLPVPAQPAAAQDDKPALRATATVTSDIVRIGDLVENAGIVADVPIFRAPDLGTKGAVATDRVLEAIRPHQLIGIDTRGLAEVIVTRASRTITADEISAGITHALQSQYGFVDVDHIGITFDHAPHPLHVEPDATGDLEIASLSYDPRTARFDITLDLPTSAAMRRLAPHFTGTAIATIDAVTVDHPVERGEILKASDITISRLPKSEGPAISDVNRVVGLAARQQLRPGQPLHEADLTKPAIVQRSDTVTIIYEAPGITLTLRGMAQEAGALGDQINVENLQSKHIAQGIITGPGRVTITANPVRAMDAGAAAPAPAAAPPTVILPSEAPQHERRVSSAE
jgi:flagellar basal body P-ring formation protein FlgA